MCCACALAGCADTVDIGETSYAMVLADDLDGSGHMDLVLATMNGNIYCFQTAARYHPLKAWPSQVALLSQTVQQLPDCDLPWASLVQCSLQ